MKLLNLAPPLSTNYIRIPGTGTQHQVLSVGAGGGDLTLIFRVDKELEGVETASGQKGRWAPEEERGTGLGVGTKP